MGWKLACVFISEAGLEDCFSSSDQLDKENILKADNLKFLSLYKSSEKTFLESLLYPAVNELGVGAYSGGYAFCGSILTTVFFDNYARKKLVGNVKNSEAIKSELMSLCPEGQILSLMLHSVVGLWAYSFHDKGNLIRAAAGTADHGILCNIGELLPEERAVLRKNSIESLDQEGAGEELVLDQRGHLNENLRF